MSIRCLLVDDSPTFRQLLRTVLSADLSFTVIGEASDGLQAVVAAGALRPDVIALDVNMPGQDGVAALRQILAERFVPVVLVSALAGGEAARVTFQALAAGAVEVVAKPSTGRTGGFSAQLDALREALRRAAAVQPPARVPPRGLPALISAPNPIPRVLGVAASTGGPPALQGLLAALGADFPAPILVVQHLAQGFERELARWLEGQTALQVQLASDDAVPQAGTVYLAPWGRHLVWSRGRLRLVQTPAVRGFRPSADVLFTSLAEELGREAAGAVLTGMGEDGAAGLLRLREAGGVTFAQGEKTSVVFGMPRAAQRAGAALHVVELDELPWAVETVFACGPRRRRRLLLVDDSETVLSVERHLLARRYELFSARDGEEALEAALRLRPDGILLDQQLPSMTGLELLHWLRRRQELREVPVLILTADRSPALSAACHAAGCRAVLHKPIDPARLSSAVQELVPS